MIDPVTRVVDSLSKECDRMAAEILDLRKQLADKDLEIKELEEVIEDLES